MKFLKELKNRFIELQEKPYSNNEAKQYFKKHNKQIFTVFFFIIALIMTVNFIDFYLLPTKKISDTIEYSRTIKNKNSLLAREYTTELKNSFSTSKKITSNVIEIEQTLIFKNVVGLKTLEKDYTSKLNSSMNGYFKYFYYLLYISLIYSLIRLFTKKNISLNSYLNIVIFNSVLLFIWTYKALLLF